MDNCKVCGAMMQNFECCDSEYTSTEHFEYIHAYCPCCHKWYRWIEVFSFSRVSGFEEDV